MNGRLTVGIEHRANKKFGEHAVEAAPHQPAILIAGYLQLCEQTGKNAGIIIVKYKTQYYTIY